MSARSEDPSTSPRTPPPPRGLARLATLVVFAAALGLFAARALDTARTFNNVFDEPGHIAVGIELYQYGSCDLDALHPPLSRWIVALPYWLAGVRFAEPPESLQRDRDSTRLLYDGTAYWPALFVARAEIAALGVVFLAALFELARRRLGTGPALVALVVTSVAPTFLALASLATTDFLGAVTFLVALAAWRWLLEAPSLRRAAGFGVALGFALLSKLTAVPFLLASMPVVTLWLRGRDLLPALRAPLATLRAVWRMAGTAALACALTISAGYGFDVEPLDYPIHAEETAASLARHSEALGAAYRIVAATPVPLRGFVRAIRKSIKASRTGQTSYLAGQNSLHGFPHYYILTTLLKTPLGTLAAAALALGLALRRRADPAAREVLILASLVGAIFLAATSGRLNIGHRHIASIEPLTALLIAAGMRLALDGAGAVRRLAAPAFVGLTALAAASSLAAHPDALGFTNALAGPRPDRWLADPNLDWGQDLERLGLWLRDHRVTEPIHLAYVGTAWPERHGVRAVPLPPRAAVAGWSAVSINALHGLWAFEGVTDGYAWLLDVPEVATVGTSIRVYHLSPEQAAGYAEAAARPR